MVDVVLVKSSPLAGRWQREALTEGAFVPTRHSVRLPSPSTTLRAVPLPVPGRIG